ncbi:hypothetical protein PI124_g6745 [Phytophthora idaei]|nr:hypothetical protein PI125_g13367 [Phytophthora idaei]KAG3149320.1 hypothetical protein PI126_g12061 [Phytophthora idaei]KAG3248577.1 hypothetical protein PI124_g6745 [Phytophthora idaei]
MGGRTAHSTFKIPLKLNDTSTCSIFKQSHLKGLIQKASLVIWDEAPMDHWHAVEAVDRSLLDLMDNDEETFGGKVSVLSGDVRQILPLVVRGTPAQRILRPHVIHATIMTGERQGQHVLISRIVFISDGDSRECRFRLRCKQFPVRDDYQQAAKANCAEPRAESVDTLFLA